MKLSIETPSAKMLNKLNKKWIVFSSEKDTYKIIVNEYNEIQWIFNKNTFKTVIINKNLEKEIYQTIEKYKKRKEINNNTIII